jgi:copper(I)-binding protein
METLSAMKPSHLASLAALALASCNQGATPAATESPAAGQISVAAGKLVLPAVAGNPGAAYFTVTNGTAQPVSLAAVSIEGATKAEMHETTGGSMEPLAALTVGPGASAAFAPGGKHVMVFGVRKSLQPGASTTIALTFAGGKTASGPLQVTAAGGEEMH